ncbi:MAG: TlpA family protein disulfide reductase [Nitrospinae bacterium]|nr:TlpA family protein disulfide reductase [Nitrospinota bacterium]
MSLALFLIGLVNVDGLHSEEKIPAPDFTLMTMDNKKMALKDYKGKYVFLNFWATWCGPCIDEMPSMERLYQKLKSKKNFEMLAVSIDKGGAEVVKRFVKENKLTFTVLLDRDSEVAAAYGVMGIPATYLIDPNGDVINKASGARDWDSKDSLKFFEKMLGGK